MRHLVLAMTAAFAVATAALTIATSGAFSAGLQSPSCGTWKVRKDETIDKRPRAASARVPPSR